MSENKCLEQVLDDIVGIEVYDLAECNMPVPVNVAVLEIIANVNTFPEQPLWSAWKSEGSDAMILDAATIKISSAANASGYIYTHSYSIPLDNACAIADAAVMKMQGKNLVLVCTHRDGERSMSAALPNATQTTIDEQLAKTDSVGIKIECKSLSPMIKLKAEEE
ncbi:MAG: hypothetical protein HUK05_07240 [Prevotella sp.]|nr:hypothetical protein [Prevotella sp.]MCF0243460.1 hypothetical protein [Bacteroidaceae bacterium]